MNRIKAVQDYLKEHTLDAFLVLTKVNRQYLSGFTGSKGALLITPRAAKLFVDERYTIRAKKESDLPVHNPLHLLLILRGRVPPLRVRGGKGELRIGIEDEVTLYQFDKLKKEIRGVRWKVTRRVVEHIRARKEPQELRAIRKGAGIIDATFRHILKMVSSAKALRESDIALEIEKFGKKLGASALAFDPIVAFGSNAAAPHHASSTSRKIGRNSFLLLDFGFVVNGYNSDFTRTLFIGSPNKKQEKIYNTVHRAQFSAMEKIKKGMKCSVVDQEARDYIAGAGFGKNFTHCSGHGVGLEIHEAPNLCPDSDEVLPEHSVVTVEPGIYIEGWGGVRIEDMVVVKQNGAKPMSGVPKDLKSMLIK